MNEAAVETLLGPSNAYEYLVSDDNGKSWIMVAIVSHKSITKIQAKPLSRGYMRKFVPLF